VSFTDEVTVGALTPDDAPPFSLPIGIPLVSKVLDVYDGDTITVALEIFPKTFRSFRMRLEGIDTPELRPPLNIPGRKETVAAAEAARDYLSALVKSAVVYVVISGTEKFGRPLCKMYLADNGGPGECVNDLIVESGFGQLYEGGARS
jgi:endonuclease YncB( thermonuclease family)